MFPKTNILTFSGGMPFLICIPKRTDCFPFIKNISRLIWFFVYVGISKLLKGNAVQKVRNIFILSPIKITHSDIIYPTDVWWCIYSIHHIRIIKGAENLKNNNKIMMMQCLWHSLRSPCSVKITYSTVFLNNFRHLHRNFR